MITTAVLIIVGIAQAAFIVGLLALLLSVHRRRDTNSAIEAAGRLQEPLRAFMLGETDCEPLSAVLRTLERGVAVRQLLSITATHTADAQTAALSALIRSEPWVVQTLKLGRSVFWWKRMEAARLLAVVHSPADLPLLTALVCDRHPAVAGAATGAIQGCADDALIVSIVRGLSGRPTSVRSQQMRALRSYPDVAAAIVAHDLARETRPVQLCALVQCAELLGDPAALVAVIQHASHRETNVRAAVARALRGCYSAEAVTAATILLSDADWRVRAAAARALGALNVSAAIPKLTAALSDPEWWVRFRAALALGALGEDGERSLTLASLGDDEFARDMAVVVQGLSLSARVELSA